jgi:hypothetical protein
MRDDENDQTCSLNHLLQVSNGNQVVRQLDIRQVSLIPVCRVDNFSQVSAVHLTKGYISI